MAQASDLALDLFSRQSRQPTSAAQMKAPVTSPTERSLKPLYLWFPVGFTLALLTIGLADHEFYRTRIDGELGLLETAQLVPPLLAILLVLSLLGDGRTAAERGLRAWLLLVALACVYLVGEEVSWGQHYFGWGTPDWIAAVNRQHETNLHNTSTWLNEKPRSLFEIGVVAGGIVHPLLLTWRGRGLLQRPWWLAPGIACLPSAVLAELWRLPERLFEAEWLQASLTAGVVRPVLDFARYSEGQELYFFYFIFIYVLSIRRRIRTRPSPGASA